MSWYWFYLDFRIKHKVEYQDICIFVVITDSMVLCAKIGPSILNADLSDLAGECTRLLDQVCVWRKYQQERKRGRIEERGKYIKRIYTQNWEKCKKKRREVNKREKWRIWKGGRKREQKKRKWINEASGRAEGKQMEERRGWLITSFEEVSQIWVTSKLLISQMTSGCRLLASGRDGRTFCTQPYLRSSCYQVHQKQGTQQYICQTAIVNLHL